MRKTLLVLILAAACTTSSLRPANIVKPEASVEALGSPFFSDTNEAPVDLGVTITNRAAEPLLVRAISVNSMGMSQYRIRSIRQRFHDTIAAGETKRLIVPATAETNITRLQPTEPLLLRIEVAFEAKSGRIFREVYSGQRIVF
ncbi:MAG TPA: hypothetical protein VKB93_00980 [Thermoanaerobaculia bacterium]|nr:hypothetical protein [Thermoanaerobaculia bacterium]